MKILQNRTFEFVAKIEGLDSLVGYTATCKIGDLYSKQSVLDLTGSIDGLDVTFSATPAQTKELTEEYYIFEVIIEGGAKKFSSGLTTIKSVETLEPVT